MKAVNKETVLASAPLLEEGTVTHAPGVPSDVLRGRVIGVQLASILENLQFNAGRDHMLKKVLMGKTLAEILNLNRIGCDSGSTGDGNCVSVPLPEGVPVGSGSGSNSNSGGDSGRRGVRAKVK